MSQQSRKSTSSQPTYQGQRLVVWGERREEPDWDTYIAALLSWALREVEADAPSPDGGADD